MNRKMLIVAGALGVAAVGVLLWHGSVEPGALPPESETVSPVTAPETANETAQSALTSMSAKAAVPAEANAPETQRAPRPMTDGKPRSKGKGPDRIPRMHLTGKSRESMKTCMTESTPTELSKREKARYCQTKIRKELKAEREARRSCESDDQCLAAKDRCGWWRPINAAYKDAFESESAERANDRLCKRRPPDEGPAPAMRCEPSKKRCVRA